MRILVTGGAGFIGSHVVDAYVAVGHQVAILDDFSTGSLDNVNVNSVYKANICDRVIVRQIMELVRPDVVNHHAAMVDVTECEENPGKARKVNVAIHLRLVGWRNLRGVSGTSKRNIPHETTWGIWTDET